MSALHNIARTFVDRRARREALADYPGDIPADMAHAYAIQDLAISLREEPVVGWKIGRLSPENQARFGTERLCGPVFASRLKRAEDADETLSIDVIPGGFAAVEAEYVFELGLDIQPGQVPETPIDVLRALSAVYAGVEMAGSPLLTINDLGPTVVASDYGNNNGLILGPRLVDLTSARLEDLDVEALSTFRAETFIDGEAVGRGGLFTMPGGPLAALAWLFKHLDSRGYPLKKGMLVSSGATTGIHDVRSGQMALVRFMGPMTQEHELVIRTVDAPQ
ncbi:MAG: 2-keto-4-pentenoate hydratase [Asticcacaulis sp.]